MCATAFALPKFWDYKCVLLPLHYQSSGTQNSGPQAFTVSYFTHWTICPTWPSFPKVKKQSWRSLNALLHHKESYLASLPAEASPKPVLYWSLQTLKIEEISDHTVCSPRQSDTGKSMKLWDSMSFRDVKICQMIQTSGVTSPLY